MAPLAAGRSAAPSQLTHVNAPTADGTYPWHSVTTVGDESDVRASGDVEQPAGDREPFAEDACRAR